MRQWTTPSCCTVVLEIRTTATHALRIIQGRTFFSPADIHVIDLDGRRLTEADLVGLETTERQLSSLNKLSEEN